MECVDPGAVSDDAMLAYACGETIAAVASHVTLCAFCASIVAVYAESDRRLATSLARLDCPTALVLGELALDLLSHQEALAIRAHLADCPRCGAELSTLVDALRGDPLADQKRAPGFFRRIAASLAPAPGHATALAGLRGGVGGTRVYKAEEVTISLIDQAAGQGAARSWSLLGLIDAPGPTPEQPSEVTLTTDSGPVASAPVDELGNFSLAHLRPGTYSIELQFPDRVIVLDSVTIGGSSA